jgi:hypothetical protein
MSFEPLCCLLVLADPDEEITIPSRVGVDSGK